MGLFTRRRDDESPEGLTTPEALAGIAVSAMFADHVLSAEEDADLAVYLRKMKAFRRLGTRDLDAIFRKVHDLALREGDAALLERSCDALPERLHPTAYFLAADLLMGDDEFGADEQRFLKNLQSLLAVDDATAAKVTEALSIKHAG